MSTPRFETHIKQHDSQTDVKSLVTLAMFETHLKQHDSQTSNLRKRVQSRRVFR